MLGKLARQGGREPSPDLYRKVRGLLVLKGSSFNRWCRENRVERKYAERSLIGLYDGPAARRIRARLLEDAGLVGDADAA